MPETTSLYAPVNSTLHIDAADATFVKLEKKRELDEETFNPSPLGWFYERGSGEHSLIFSGKQDFRRFYMESRLLSGVHVIEQMHWFGDDGIVVVGLFKGIIRRVQMRESVRYRFQDFWEF